MNEKIFKTIRGTGAASLAVGIVVLVTGISAGVIAYARNECSSQQGKGAGMLPCIFCNTVSKPAWHTT